MLRLGVNIDHVATLRQARYRDVDETEGFAGLIPEPDPVAAALEVEQAGAHGITIHLREDRRHILDRDLRLLRHIVRRKLNLEMADVAEIVTIALEVRPDDVCLVPERRSEVTTEGGLNAAGTPAALAGTVARLHEAGISVSLFIDPDLHQVRAAADIRADSVELHTGAYANARDRAAVQAELNRLINAAEVAHQLGLRVNAGHGLNYQNTLLILTVPHLETLNIGHAIIARSVFVGLRQAVQEMLATLQGAR